MSQTLRSKMNRSFEKLASRSFNMTPSVLLSHDSRREAGCNKDDLSALHTQSHTNTLIPQVCRQSGTL